MNKNEGPTLLRRTPTPESLPTGGNVGEVGFGGQLDTKLIRGGVLTPHKVRQLRIPGIGRLMFSRDRGDALQTGSEYFQTRLHAMKFDGDGRFVDEYDLGSGNVQMNFVAALMQEQAGSTNNKASPILASCFKYMYSGTGSTVNTYDVQLATGNATASGLITPTLGYSADSTTIQSVATIAYTGTVAVTEWGIFNNNTQGIFSTSTVNTFTAQGVASATWGTSLGAANAEAGWVIYLTSTTTGGYVLSHTSGTPATVVTAVSPTLGWYNLTAGGGAATTPSTNTSMSLYPLMSDHKTFSVINVINGDSIQFTYTLTLTSGG